MAGLGKAQIFKKEFVPFSAEAEKIVREGEGDG